MRGRLQRLVGRPREHRRRRVAGSQRDGAVGGERDHAAAVHSLDEPGPDDLGQHRGGRGRRRQGQSRSVLSSSSTDADPSR